MGSPISATSSAAPTSSLLDSTQSTSRLPFSSSFNQNCAIKLERTNYLVWSTVIVPVIKGHKLDGHIYGTSVCPPEIVTEGSATRRNSDHDDWVAVDQLLMGWLLNSMSLDLASQMIGCHTAKDVWDRAKILAGSQSRSRITLYRCEMQKLRKDDLTMEQYLDKMKSIANNLSLAGVQVSDEDLITQTLSGLGLEYNPIVVQLMDKTNLTWVDLQTSLLTFASRLEQINALSSLSLALSTYYFYH